MPRSDVGHVVAELVPLGGEEPPRMDGEPVDVGGRARADGADHHGGHLVRVALGVGRAEHRSPREPEDDPALDVEVLAEPLDVGDVVVHVDARPVDAPLAGVRGAAPRRPLVEQHGAMALQVEVAAGARGAAGARTAVQVDDGRALRVADLLDVEDMPVADVEVADGERFWRWFVHPAQSGRRARLGRGFTRRSCRLRPTSVPAPTPAA